ncbi:toll/interleukin-like receptor-protein [Medicago truncatula]|uniref:Toll/interleukin-like receptor-protein n=1 Tax=Medicago truncatula TaxID=3880 RepID=G7K8H8_MEDTR|nr:toll/interleukin-like receptor-protein [Medicago truncatula]
MNKNQVDGSYKYDVFLCFRKVDTYYTFTGSLYHALRNKRIKTFYPHETDIKKLQPSPIVLKAIKECMKMKNQLVWPIFFKVEPWEVRNQKGRFGEAMLKLEKWLQNYPYRILQWKKALHQVSLIAGWNYGAEFEYELFKKIVESTVQSLPRYDVFLSFCGEDTRYSFTGFLYHDLRHEGFKIFMDDEGLKGGNQISQTLLKAIEKSRLSIVVLSENFGYSTWCLDELVKIMEYVSNQTKSYGKAMAAHEDRFGKECENVQKWKSALSEVALLKADHIKENEYEYEFIKKIVERAIEAENHM